MKSIIVAFDTEATNLENYAVLYSWDWLENYLDIAVTVDNVSEIEHVTGRDVPSLYNFLNTRIEAAYNGEFTYRVGVHNLSYDAGYLRKWLADIKVTKGMTVDVIARSTTNVLSFVIKKDGTPVIIFFDTLAIFSQTLRSIGASMGFSKLEIDYNACISPETELSADNIAYNNRDTEILLAAIYQNLLTIPGITENDLGTVILTKTGIVRVTDRKSPVIGALKMDNGSTIYANDRAVVKRHQFTTLKNLQRWSSYSATRNEEVKGCYAGGINLSNMNTCCVLLNEVHSFDLKSAYPSEMLSMRVPTNGHDVPNKSVKSYNYLLDVCPDPVEVTYSCVFWRGTVRLTNVDVNDEWLASVGDVSINETMVIQHGKSNEGVKFKDGHFSHADVLYLTVTTPTWCEVMTQFDYDNAEFVELTVYDGWERPTWYNTLRTLHHFREKTAAKLISKGRYTDQDLDIWFKECLITPTEYSTIKGKEFDKRWLDEFVARHKSNLNSLYGIEVTDPCRDEYEADDNMNVNTKSADDDGKWLNYSLSRRNGMMWREFGVCVPLFNRWKVVYAISLIAKAGGQVVYSDTDSIKVVGLTVDEIRAILKPLHDKIEARTYWAVDKSLKEINRRCSTYFEVPDYEDFKQLGTFDYEGTYTKFISTGHKKYCYMEDGDEYWTVKASGYDLETMKDVSDSLVDSGVVDNAPLITIGFGTRYDSNTGISSAQYGVSDTWIPVEFTAWNSSDDSSCTHVYRGMTCPGYSINRVGKIVHNFGSELEKQRYAKSVKNNRNVEMYSLLDVTVSEEEFLIGKRGTVAMEYSFVGDDI